MMRKQLVKTSPGQLWKFIWRFALCVHYELIFTPACVGGGGVGVGGEEKECGGHCECTVGVV